MMPDASLLVLRFDPHDCTVQSMKVKPAKMLAPTTASPYSSPMLRTRRVAAEESSLLLAEPVAAAPLPPKPVYTAPPEAVDAAAPVAEAVAGIVLIVEVLTLVGF